MNNLLKNFYTTERKSINMSDGGGAFGFDIHFALEVNYLINVAGCDAFIETGTNTGDTIDYVSKQYSNLDIISSEVDTTFYSLATERLKDKKNVSLYLGSSEQIIKKYQTKYKFPFYYLDAHWNSYWPLADEIRNIERGIVCVSDFFIGEDAFNSKVSYGFDSYNGIVCDKNIILQNTNPDTPIYVNNASNLEVYEYPSMQVQRRAGRAYFCKGITTDFFNQSLYFKPIPY